MQDLKDVYFRVQMKKKERKTLMRSFQDSLEHNGEYQTILEDLRVLKEKKKSIENQAKAEALSDVRQIEELSEEIKNTNELLSDITLTKYVEREQVEIIDEDKNERLVPVFSVRFKREEGESTQRQAEAARAMSHPERTFVPSEANAEETDEALQPA